MLAEISHVRPMMSRGEELAEEMGFEVPARHRKLLAGCWGTDIEVQHSDGEGNWHLERGEHLRLDHFLQYRLWRQSR